MSFFSKPIEEHLDLVKDFYFQRDKFLFMTNEIYQGIFLNGKKLLIFGNGGSAADAQHIAGEFVGKFKKERSALPAIALNTDTSVLTSLGNDYGFDSIFERQISALAKSGDILLGISTSGNSKNVIRGLEKGKDIGTSNLALLGNNGGEIYKKDLSDLSLIVHSNNTPRIQEAHMLAYHIICELVENKVYEKEAQLRN